MTLRTLPAAVLFDMDGTLVDTEHLWWEATVEVATGLGLTLDERDVPQVLGQAVEHTAAHLSGRCEGARSTAELAVKLQELFIRRVAAEVVPRPGALNLLTSLHEAGVPTALVSASPREVVDLVLRTLGTQWFTVTLAAEDTPRTKPEPDPYLAAAALLGLDPAHCVAVEDTPTGVASAHAAGCAVLAVPSAVPIAAAPGITLLDSLVHADLALLAALVPRQATFAPSRRPARPLAAPDESPSTSSTRTSARHAESTHRTPLLDGQKLPDAALTNPAE